METKQTRKDVLLEVGADVMLAQGYHGTGVQQIVDAAGVPKGSFYNYFKSKEDFAIKAMEHASRQALLAFEQALRSGVNSPAARIVATFRSMADGYAARGKFVKGCLVGNMCQEMADTHPMIAEKAEYIFRNYTAALAGCLRAGQVAGEISKGYDCDKLADFLFNSWEGAVMRMKASQDARPLNAFINTLETIIKS